jgi:hypothetical protein
MENQTWPKPTWTQDLIWCGTMRKILPMFSKKPESLNSLIHILSIDPKDIFYLEE